MFSNIFIK